MGKVRPMPPRGHYLPYEVARLVGVDPKQIGQWARFGYIRSSQGERPRIYSYQDIVEALVVHDLLENYGVSHKDIRQVVDALGRPEEYGDWPLTHAELWVVRAKGGGRGKPRAGLVVRENEHDYDFKKKAWQTVERRSLEPLLKRAAQDLARGGWVTREVAIKHVEVNPDRLSGRPTIRGRRLPVESVADLARTREGRAVLRDEYDLSKPEIDDAVRWWDAVSKYAA